MSIIMGGSGSTGSSLLKNILNRHEDVFAGEETSLFAKRLVYDNWSKARKRITKRKLRGLRNYGFHLYNGTDLIHQEYLVTIDEVEAMAMSSNSLGSFCEKYYHKALDDTNAKYWLEKTPANSSCFKLFLNEFPDGKVIHMVRNPYDTIASLYKRGFDIYYAVGIYLLNTSSGLSAKSFNERYHEVSYESLVKDPKSIIFDLCKFLNIGYQDNIIESRGEDIAVSKLRGWNYDETSNIGKGAVGRFAKLSEAEQSLIMEAVNMIQINKRGLDYYEVEEKNVEQICDQLGYEFYPISSRSHKGLLTSQRSKDIWTRIRRGYTNGRYYPLEIL